MRGSRVFTTSKMSEKIIHKGEKIFATYQLTKHQDVKYTKNLRKSARKRNNSVEKWAQQLVKCKTKEKIQMANKYEKKLNFISNHGNTN